MYRLNQVKLNIYHSEEDFKKKIAKTSGVSVGDIDWSTLIILHKSIDARDKKNILFVYNVAFDFADVAGGNSRICNRNVATKKLEKYEQIIFNPIVLGSHSSPVRDMGSHSSPVRYMSSQCDGNKSEGNIRRPVVVGFGPAGIFAAYILALNGLKPIVVERGKSLDDRVKDVDKFFETLELDENSNVCFGEGGAGAFSDGKLNTNNKDKTGIYHFVLETFVKFGADKKILYENMPHIGTDKLVGVIKNIREEIIKLGGEIHYNTKLVFRDGLAQLAHTSGGSQCFAPTDTSIAPADTSVAPTITKDTPIILAIGNSSRDTFRELIENGFDVQAKPIAVGYRVAHRQSLINNAQYGEGGLAQLAHTSDGSHSIANTEVGSQSVAPVGVSNVLGPATYKLTYDVGNGHSVYSFCMCPGGYIINSSNFKGKLSINGMSYNDRSGKYANSAIVETIKTEDVVGARTARPYEDDSASVSRDDEGSNSFAPPNAAINSAETALKMIEFQERVEQAAFELEKGFIPYVTSDGRDICHEDVFKGQAKQCEKLKSVFENCGLKFDINKDIEEALKHFNKIIPGFFGEWLAQLAHTEGLAQLARTSEGSQCVAPTDDLQYIIAGVETRTSSPVKLDRDENYMCNVPNFYPCGEGLGHGGGIMSCAVDGIKVAISIINKYKK